MIASSRVQAAIEIVDAILGAARAGGAPADAVIQLYFRARRYAGSKDRRAVRALVYGAIRRAGEQPASGRAALLGLAREQPDLMALFDGSPHGPAPFRAGEEVASAGVLPQWLRDTLESALGAGQLEALLDRAPLDLRANRLRIDRDALLAMLDGAVAGTLAPDAFRLPEGTVVERLPEWRAGLFEVQDEGSQLVAEACEARPGETIVDLCAGAGGKTLALAAAMAGRGRLVACDVDRARLRHLRPRAERAGAANIEERLLDGGREAAGLADLEGSADIVLVDAPCSGSGTWRRNPEARWRLTPDRLARLAAVQARVLMLGSALVKPGGRLVYAACSLLAEEGDARIAAFLADRGGWTIERPPFGRALDHGALLTPASDGTDGFFVARLRRA